MSEKKDNSSPLDYEVGGDHYKRLNPQPIEVIIAWRLDFCLGNAIKYIARSGRKESAAEDLKKAIHYLNFKIETLEKDINN